MNVTSHRLTSDTMVMVYPVPDEATEIYGRKIIARASSLLVTEGDPSEPWKVEVYSWHGWTEDNTPEYTTVCYMRADELSLLAAKVLVHQNEDI